MVIEIKDKNLYYVGGVVRDEILGIQSFDTDFCYEGNAIEFAKREGFKIIRENPDFGTVRVLINEEEVDIASTRKESYPQKGHLPTVEAIGCPLKDDLARRDFTINALAKNTVTGEIVDYFNGLDDLKSKRLRVLHNDSFIDDPTRIIRGLKFSVRFGFELDEHTKLLQDEYLKNINYDMCYHRIKKELKETFNLNIELAYDKFISQNLYTLLSSQQVLTHPKTSISNLITQFIPNNVWIVYLGQFDLSKLELTRDENDIIATYHQIKNIFPTSEIEAYRLFKNMPLEAILLYALYSNYEIALNYLTKVKDINIELNGKDLKALGIPQGKLYKEIFEYLIEQKISGKILTKEDEILAVKRNFL